MFGSSFRSAVMYNEYFLTINSTSKMSLNLLIPATVILIFSLLDYCHSFLMGLPISRVTTFQSTHWTAARVCFLNNKSNLVVHTIKILQWISATCSMKIQTPKHSLQRLVLIWLLCLSSATQDYPPWTSLSLASCNALLCCYGFSHAVSRPGTAFLFSTPKHQLILQVAPVLGSSSFAPLWVFWITISCTSLEQFLPRYILIHHFCVSFPLLSVDSFEHSLYSQHLSEHLAVE